MSRVRKGKMKVNTNVEKEIIAGNETTVVEHEANSEEKQKLLSDIKALRNLIIQTENRFDIMTFGDISKASIPTVEKTMKGHCSNLIDIEAIIQNELYSYGGLSCKRMGENVVFAFQSSDKGLWSNKNCIQLLKVEECWQLGKWVMPMGVNIKAVFSKHHIDSATSMKLFLRECKHLLDCYHRRQQEFRELEIFFNGLERNCGFVETNYGYTQITITLIKARRASPDESRNILIYLAYKNNEARPFKVVIDCDGENRLSDHEKMDLKALFKNIKDEDLKDVVKKVLLSKESPFISIQVSDDNSMTDTTNSDEEESNLAKILKTSKKSKPAKNQSKVVEKIEDNDNDDNSDDDRSVNDFSIDAADETKAESSERVHFNAKKSGKRGNKKSKKSPENRSLQKIKANPKEIKRSKTSRAPGKKISPLQDKKVFDTTENNREEKSLKNDEVTKTIVPEMFRPKTGKSKGILEVNKEPITLPQKPQKSNNKIGNRGGKITRNIENSAGPSSNHPHGRLLCSTPIVGRTINLSTVAEEDISAIRRENTIIAKKMKNNKRKEDTSASDNFDESDSSESNDNNLTNVMNSQKELLKDLQAVKYRATVTKKPVKRLAKSPAQGKKKKPRK